VSDIARVCRLRSHGSQDQDHKASRQDPCAAVAFSPPKTDGGTAEAPQQIGPSIVFPLLFGEVFPEFRLAGRSRGPVHLEMHEGEMTFLETDGFTFRAQEQSLPHGRRQAVQHLV
jgi:hypothetical protein